ncbi:MAG: hypothetical protein IKS03_07980 [Ruminococcus sp.]|nr:hypothetical protein [Ruminococcus sp.]
MFYIRLQKLCENKGVSISAVLKELGLSTGSTGNWKKGQLPKGDILMKLADRLDTSIDFIVFGEYRTDLDEDEKQLINLYRSAPEKTRYKLLCDMEKLVLEEIEKNTKK